VPEFEWEFVAQGPVDPGALAGKYDLVAYEDGSEKQAVIVGFPSICFIIDSTLSEAHYQIRAERARHVGVVLVDHDDLERFGNSGAVYRLTYCVNDHLFRDYGEEKTVDISFHCGSDAMRSELRRKLATFCAVNGYVYKSGILPHIEYAHAMARSKVVANWLRTPENRPHRVFDAMACGSALITQRIPYVLGDCVKAGRDYVAVDSHIELQSEAKRLLDSGAWADIAKAGHCIVMEQHTWSVRARQLRQIIGEGLGL
jgi:glycosyltransferase involved in cell wall biosynthesis